ncbi:unnamed protein product [Allacma fusca]|uniref:Uncharacterized protein n=1 Tax=Allacma fusca TaxID=39272 RepID=A0A8J2KYB7_9HEXA|nr:unnamed protein product [Allacma fusca]
MAGRGGGNRNRQGPYGEIDAFKGKNPRHMYQPHIGGMFCLFRTWDSPLDLLLPCLPVSGHCDYKIPTTSSLQLSLSSAFLVHSPSDILAVFLIKFMYQVGDLPLPLLPSMWPWTVNFPKLSCLMMCPK